MDIIKTVEKIRRKYRVDEWDESLHKRDNRGRFSNMNVAESGGYSGKVRSKIKYIENRIRHNTKEYASAVDMDGNVVLEKSGRKDGVSFTEGECKKLKNCVFTHNHPLNRTFSVEDLAFATKNGLSEMRACYGGGAYVISREYDVDQDYPERYNDFAWDFYTAGRAYKKDVVDPIWRETRDAARCDKMCEDFWRKWLRENADAYGWKYREETD